MQCVHFRRLPDFSQRSGEVFFGLIAAFGQNGGLTMHCGYTNPSSFIDELIASFQNMSFSNGTQKFGAATLSYLKYQCQTPAFGQTPVHHRTPNSWKTPASSQVPAFGQTPAQVWTPAFGKAPAFGQTHGHGRTPAGTYTGQSSSSIDKLTAAFQRIRLSVTNCSRKRPATALCRLVGTVKPQS